MVQGMDVSVYLIPAVAELGRWTRVHLVKLPGFAGSGEPTRQLDVPGYAGAVVEWLDAAGPGLVCWPGTPAVLRWWPESPAALASHRRSVARPLPRMLSTCGSGAGSACEG